MTLDNSDFEMQNSFTAIFSICLSWNFIWMWKWQKNVKLWGFLRQFFFVWVFTHGISVWSMLECTIVRFYKILNHDNLKSLFLSLCPAIFIYNDFGCSDEIDRTIMWNSVHNIPVRSILHQALVECCCPTRRAGMRALVCDIFQ